MFQFLTRWTRKSTPRPRKPVRLSLQRLESRDCPSAPQITLAVTPLAGRSVQLSGHVTDNNSHNVTVNISGVVSTTATADDHGDYSVVADADHLGAVQAQSQDDVGFVSNVATANVTSPNPSVTLSVDYLGGQAVLLSGRVSDGDPASTMVTFSGAVNDRVAVNADGTYSLQVDQPSLGTVTATAVDVWGLSATAQADITCPTPSVTLSITNVSQRTVLLTGRVTDRDPSTCVVHFTGMVQDSVQVNADGTFSLQEDAQGLGAVQATVVNAFSLSSAPAEAQVESAAPVISNFVGIERPDNLWTFTGQVTNPNAAGWTVQLGGLPSLQAETTQVADNGSFSYTVCLQPNESGTATAQVSDWWSQASNLAEALVVPT